MITTTAPLTLEQQLRLSQHVARLVRSRLPLAGELTQHLVDTDPGLATAASRVEADLLAGKSLAQSLAASDSRDGLILAACIEAGEQSGALDRTLEAWSDMHFANARDAQRLRSALVYPVLLLITMVFSLGMVIQRLVPEYRKTYLLFNQQMPDWLSTIDWLHGRLGWLLLLLALAPMALGAVWFWRLRTLDPHRMPRKRSAKMRLQGLATTLTAEMLTAGVPLVDIARLATQAMWAQEEDVRQAFARLTHRELIQPLPRETSLMLATLHSGLLERSEAVDHLRAVARHLREGADGSARRDEHWLPMAVALLVGGFTLAAYVGLVYLPWVKLLTEIVDV